jgi:hypothetical protein
MEQKKFPTGAGEVDLRRCWLRGRGRGEERGVPGGLGDVRRRRAMAGQAGDEALGQVEPRVIICVGERTSADTLRYLVATNSRAVARRKLRGL